MALVIAEAVAVDAGKLLGVVVLQRLGADGADPLRCAPEAGEEGAAGIRAGLAILQGAAALTSAAAPARKRPEQLGQLMSRGLYEPMGAAAAEVELEDISPLFPGVVASSVLSYGDRREGAKQQSKKRRLPLLPDLGSDLASSVTSSSLGSTGRRLLSRPADDEDFAGSDAESWEALSIVQSEDDLGSGDELAAGRNPVCIGSSRLFDCAMRSEGATRLAASNYFQTAVDVAEKLHPLPAPRAQMLYDVLWRDIISYHVLRSVSRGVLGKRGYIVKDGFGPGSRGLRIRGGLLTSSLRPGQAHPRVLQRVQAITALGPGDLLLDVGHGEGFACLGLAMTTGCAAYGVELVPERAAKSLQVVAALMQVVRRHAVLAPACGYPAPSPSQSGDGRGSKPARRGLILSQPELGAHREGEGGGAEPVFGSLDELLRGVGTGSPSAAGGEVAGAVAGFSSFSGSSANDALTLSRRRAASAVSVSSGGSVEVVEEEEVPLFACSTAAASAAAAAAAAQRRKKRAARKRRGSSSAACEPGCCVPCAWKVLRSPQPAPAGAAGVELRASSSAAESAAGARVGFSSSAATAASVTSREPSLVRLHWQGVERATGSGGSPLFVVGADEDRSSDDGGILEVVEGPAVASVARPPPPRAASDTAALGRPGGAESSPLRFPASSAPCAADCPPSSSAADSQAAQGTAEPDGGSSSQAASGLRLSAAERPKGLGQRMSTRRRSAYGQQQRQQESSCLSSATLLRRVPPRPNAWHDAEHHCDYAREFVLAASSHAAVCPERAGGRHSSSQSAATETLPPPPPPPPPAVLPLHERLRLVEADALVHFSGGEGLRALRAARVVLCNNFGNAWQEDGFEICLYRLLSRAMAPGAILASLTRLTTGSRGSAMVDVAPGHESRRGVAVQYKKSPLFFEVCGGWLRGSAGSGGGASGTGGGSSSSSSAAADGLGSPAEPLDDNCIDPALLRSPAWDEECASVWERGRQLPQADALRLILAARSCAVDFNPQVFLLVG